MKLNNFYRPGFVAKCLACLIAASLAACDTDGSGKVEAESVSEVVVTVSGTPITRDDIDYARKKFFGDKFVDARAERNIIESLVSSRAISNRAKSSLSDDDLREIAVAVAAYKEELLIKYLIESSTFSETVTSAEVEEYYLENQESFGAKARKVVEVAKATFYKEDRVSILEKMNEIQSGDWDFKASGVHRFKTYASALNGKLGTQVNTLKAGESTGVVVVGSDVFVARLISIEEIPAKPLAEVSKEIRRRLAARKLSERVSELSEQARSEVDIVWLSE